MICSSIHRTAMHFSDQYLSCISNRHTYQWRVDSLWFFCSSASFAFLYLAFLHWSAHHFIPHALPCISQIKCLSSICNHHSYQWRVYSLCFFSFTIFFTFWTYYCIIALIRTSILINTCSGCICNHPNYQRCVDNLWFCFPFHRVLPLVPISSPFLHFLHLFHFQTRLTINMWLFTVPPSPFSNIFVQQ